MYGIYNQVVLLLQSWFELTSRYKFVFAALSNYAQGLNQASHSFALWGVNKKRGAGTPRPHFNSKLLSVLIGLGDQSDGPKVEKTTSAHDSLYRSCRPTVD